MPKENYVRETVFEREDLVSWDPVTWSISIRLELILLVGVSFGFWGLEDRGWPLVGRLLSYCQHGTRMAI